MPQPVSPSTVQAFYQAYATRDAERLAPLIADDVKWTIIGPSQILPFCGEHHGKPAVLKLFTGEFAATIQFRSIEPEVLLVDGDLAATYLKLSGYLHRTGRVITYHCGQFVRFRDGKVVCFRSIIDSFDAAEQVLGHHIDPMHEPAQHAINTETAIVEV
ncbi:MAG: nuclear transport factor 2 family protein [Pseudorhodoplanes sp.]|jgi:ketosteroid isomerase-like protein|nr:nuclear transport factor 2 family protein [Pseudorhodoplanes sp.]